jgi:uncharacterized protein
MAMSIQTQSTTDKIVDYISHTGQAKAYDLRTLLGISNVAVHKQLKKLVLDGKIKKVGTAPLVLYVLPQRENKNLIELERIKRQILPILQHADIKKAALFGSYVRGDNTKESDIDILVELPENATLFELGGLKIDLEETLRKKVDVVQYKNISALIRDSVLSNQYPIL